MKFKVLMTKEGQVSTTAYDVAADTWTIDELGNLLFWKDGEDQPTMAFSAGSWMIVHRST